MVQFDGFHGLSTLRPWEHGSLDLIIPFRAFEPPDCPWIAEPGDLRVVWFQILDNEVLTALYGVVRVGRDGETLDYHGSGVAVAHRFMPVDAVEHGDDWRFFGRGDPVFQSVVEGNPHDHVVGVRGDAGTNRVYVARVPSGELADRAAWEFLGADGAWTQDVQLARPLFRAGPGRLSVRWNDHLEAYLAVYARPESDGQLVVFGRSAPTVSGPWDEEVELHRSADGRFDRVQLGTGARQRPGSEGQTIQIEIQDSDSLFGAFDVTLPR